MSDLPTSDPIGLDVTLGPDVIFLYHSTPTVIRTGTIAGFTPKNRNTNPPTPDLLSDPGIVAGDVTQRLRITSGPRAGTIAYVAEVLGGCCNAVTSDWSIPNPAPLPGVMPVIPQVGDTYVVERLTHVTMKGDWDITTSGNNQAFLLVGVSFTNLEFEVTPGGAFILNGKGASLGPAFQFHGSKVQGFASMTNTFSFFVNSEYIRGAAYVSGFNFIDSGLTTDAGIVPGGADIRPHFLAYQFAAGGVIDADHMVYGTSVVIRNSDVCLGLLSVFKAVPPINVLRPFPATGNGVILFNSFFRNRVFAYGAAKLWGADNAQKGVLVDTGSTFTWDGVNLPNIFGLTGLGQYTIGADAPNDMSTTVDMAAIPPVFIPLVLNTWANLLVPIPTGFNANPGPGPAEGGPQHPVTNARIVVSNDVP